VNVVVIVAVDVIDSVIVAALGNGNDVVAVIDAVNEHAACSGGPPDEGRTRSTRCSKQSERDVARAPTSDGDTTAPAPESVNTCLPR
jgi:hypothetical protein